MSHTSEIQTYYRDNGGKTMRVKKRHDRVTTKETNKKKKTLENDKFCVANKRRFGICERVFGQYVQNRMSECSGSKTAILNRFHCCKWKTPFHYSVGVKSLMNGFVDR